MKHSLKIRKQYFDSVLKLEKTFEIRKNDRSYRVGDILILHEIDENLLLTGRKLIVQVTYVYRSPNYGLMPGYCILAIKPCI